MEVPVEADLVADLSALRKIPGITGVRKYLAAQEPLNPALLKQRNLFRVTELGIRLVLDDVR